jgi:hypothetical protein
MIPFCYSLLVAIFWLIIVPIGMKDPSEHLPVYIIHASWPAGIIISLFACILGWGGWRGHSWFSKSKKHDPGCLFVFIGGIAIFCFTIYLSVTALQYYDTLAKFQVPISDAFTIVSRYPIDDIQTSKPTVIRKPFLVVVFNAYKFSRGSGADLIGKDISNNISISTECGEPPSRSEDIETIILVFRQRKLFASYTTSGHYQWLYETYVIDRRSRTLIAKRYFEGGLPQTPSSKWSDKDWYGEEPWPSIRNFLSGK